MSEVPLELQIKVFALRGSIRTRRTFPPLAHPYRVARERCVCQDATRHVPSFFSLCFITLEPGVKRYKSL